MTSPRPIHGRPEPRLAVLWDDSHLWGIMLVRALIQLGHPFELLRCSHIARTGLRPQPTRVLIVPGGWAVSKAAGLGQQGLEAIRAYVRSGGGYLGFCGGAGFALSTGGPESCLGLCSWSRKPIRERLPNCSGHMYLRTGQAGGLATEAPAERVLAPVWWPSQFQPCPGENQPTILASYLAPGRDFWVADLPLRQAGSGSLKAREAQYNINLRPEILTDEPALITGRYGSGSYLLSYAHLESPASPQANQWLANILARLTRTPLAKTLTQGGLAEWDIQQQALRWEDPVLRRSKQSLLDCIFRGCRENLLSWRKPWLLGWKRGLPGFALNALLAMVTEAGSREPGPESQPYWSRKPRARSGVAALLGKPARRF